MDETIELALQLNDLRQVVVHVMPSIRRRLWVYTGPTERLPMHLQTGRVRWEWYSEHAGTHQRRTIYVEVLA